MRFHNLRIIYLLKRLYQFELLPFTYIVQEKLAEVKLNDMQLPQDDKDKLMSDMLIKHYQLPPIIWQNLDQYLITLVLLSQNQINTLFNHVFLDILLHQQTTLLNSKFARTMYTALEISPDEFRSFTKTQLSTVQVYYGERYLAKDIKLLHKLSIHFKQQCFNLLPNELGIRFNLSLPIIKLPHEVKIIGIQSDLLLSMMQHYLKNLFAYKLHDTNLIINNLREAYD